MAQDKMKKVMGEYKRGTLHSGSKTGKKVTSRKQAVAIALSEARKAGQKVSSKHSMMVKHHSWGSETLAKD